MRGRGDFRYKALETLSFSCPRVWGKVRGMGTHSRYDTRSGRISGI